MMPSAIHNAVTGLVESTMYVSVVDAVSAGLSVSEWPQQ